MADGGSFKSGRKLLLQVPQGTTASIEFPVRPQIVSMTGRLYCRNQNYEINDESWESQAETAQCAAVQVISMHHSVMFVGGDESIWGMGFRSQGMGEENCKLRRIESPEGMKNLKKVAHGKFFRVVLTQDGRLFYNG